MTIAIAIYLVGATAMFLWCGWMLRHFHWPLRLLRSLEVALVWPILLALAFVPDPD